MAYTINGGNIQDYRPQKLTSPKMENEIINRNNQQLEQLLIVYRDKLKKLDTLLADIESRLDAGGL